LLRGLIAVLAASAILVVAPAAPARAAADAKVVVIVGPVGASTSHYKADANAIAAEARRYTSNVVKVYTPNATWSKVKAAAQGASVLVYLGHGNGWPSPYPPFQTNTKDGFGLDPSTGANSSKTVYYGEEWIRSSIRLAPNAVVLLFHLCYASGNTEPGKAVGSFGDAQQRVDNYGAGFIGAGARAVFAEGHPEHPVTSYVRQLFTTGRTMEQIFRAAPTFHGHIQGPFDSQRTPGLAYLMDPDTASPSGFYRSLVGDLGLSADMVTGSKLKDTGVTPPDFVVPGAAEVIPDAGAGLFRSAAAAADPAGKPTSTLKAGTRVRVTREADPAEDGSRILAVQVLGSSTEGFMRAPDLAPRDSAGPMLWSLDASHGMLSPNGDGTYDQLVVSAHFSETVTSSLVVRNAAGTKVKGMSATGDIARFAWNLRDSSGKPLPDGSYTWRLKAQDGWGNEALVETDTFVVDSAPPSSTAGTEATAGRKGWLVSPVTVSIRAKDATSGVGSIQWRVDGRSVTRYGEPAVYDGNGSHTFQYRAVDKAGVKEKWHSIALKIDTKPPVISVGMDGTAGDVEATWRSKVKITPTVTDATSGVAAKTVSVDGGDKVPLATSVTVKGDGDHTVTVTARDVAGNTSSLTTSFRIDRTAPVIDLPSEGGEAQATIPSVSPNGDGTGDSVTLPFTVSEAGTVTAVITDSAGKSVRTLSADADEGKGTLTWDGRTAGGAPVPDGRYTVTFAARDAAGNAGVDAATQVDVYAALTGISRTPSLFFPQDGDKLARKAVVSFKLLSPATVTVLVLDANGTTVRTGRSGVKLRAGAASWAWNGKLDDGSFAPRGLYRIQVTATNGTQSASLSTSVRADAFTLKTSAETASRRAGLVLTATTAESLRAAPKVVVRQPGLAPWSVTMTRHGSTRWTATITPRKGGTTGSLVLVVRATDSLGGSNSSRLVLPLQ
jgi:flagellar hook assembly protein FlgD